MKILCALALLAAVSTQAATAREPVQRKDSSVIGADGTAYVTRVVPIPRTISPQAQASLARPLPDEAAGLASGLAPAVQPAVAIKLELALVGVEPDFRHRPDLLVPRWADQRGDFPRLDALVVGGWLDGFRQDGWRGREDQGATQSRDPQLLAHDALRC